MRVIVAGAVIMTGATTVMGLATARLLAAEGADALPAAARSRLSRLGLAPGTSGTGGPSQRTTRKTVAGQSTPSADNGSSIQTTERRRVHHV